jgi:hypothetical protein
MPRDQSAANATAIAGEVVRPVRLVELDFASEFVRAASTPFSVFFDSDGDMVDEEFRGVGNLGRVSAIGESVGGQAGRLSVTLSGVDPANVAIALNQKYQGRRASIWRGNLDEDHAFVDPPDLEFRGLMDTMPIKLRTTGTISVVVVDRFTRWEKPLDNPRWDNADQQARRPGDTFFRFVPELVQGREVIWGRG